MFNIHAIFSIVFGIVIAQIIVGIAMLLMMFCTPLFKIYIKKMMKLTEEIEDEELFNS